MSAFAAAYKAGIEAGQKALENVQDIDAVFQALDKEIAANSGGKIHIAREMLSKTRWVRRMPSQMDELLGLYAPKPYSYYDDEISYDAIVAKNSKNTIEIATYELSEAGYPITIKWADREESCWDSAALAETLQEVLSDVNTGKILIRLLSDEISNN